jgi:hypothetical protein
MACNNKAVEALGKIIKIFTKKEMEKKRKSFYKEWVGVSSSNCNKDLTCA